MDKINFQDGTKVSNAKVTIDEVDYTVTPARYNGATPLSAYVMNKLQDNIEDAIDQNADNIGGEDYDATSTYDVGDIVKYQGQLYKCTTEISTAEDWTVAHWTETSIVEEIDNGGGSSNVENEYSTSTTEPYSANYVNNAIPEIKTSYNTSTTEPYSCNYINNLNTYSTTETRIGTWIDGKPLYRKVLTFENKEITDNNNSSECVHNVSNLDFGIVREAYYDFNGENVWCTASNVITTGKTSYNVGYKVGSSSIYLKYVSELSFDPSNTRKWLFIIEYTKTTD